MDDSNNSSNGGKNYFLYTILFIIVLLVLGGLVFIFFFNKSKIDQITRTLTQTQQEVQNVKSQAQEQVEEAKEENPEAVARLALARAYASLLKESLTTADQADIDRITLYVEGNPDVLITKNPNLPQDIAQAVANIKLKAKTLKNAAVATIKDNVDQATYAQNEVVTLSGTIEFVEDDTVYGGSIFSLTDEETGNVFYLHFNDTNSQNIKNTMLGETVTVNVRVTSKANEPLTFEVIKGPTLVVQSSPSPAPTP